jgi:hypothetical protein
MFGIGGMDAYFCDAYTDVLARLLRAKQLEPNIDVPYLSTVMLPMDAILSSYAVRDNWKWRMAARGKMERENSLVLEQIKGLFNNIIFGDKLFADNTLRSWAGTPGWDRWFGPDGPNLLIPAPGGRASNHDTIRQSINSHFKDLCQRRHDCIHNCDRPKVRPQPIRPIHATQAVADIEWLVHRIDPWLDAGFSAFVTDLGFSSVTKNKIRC